MYYIRRFFYFSKVYEQRSIEKRQDEVINKIADVVGNAEVETRDARRIADVRQIITAVELYWNDQGTYPPNVTPGGAISSFINEVPGNPLPNDGVCDTNFEYEYKVLDNGQSYELSYCLGETTKSGDRFIKAGYNKAGPEGIAK